MTVIFVTRCTGCRSPVILCISCKTDVPIFKKKKNPNSPGKKKNHYTLQGLEGCHKELYYFSSFNEQVDCAYCNFHRAPLNNSVTFSVRSFHSGGCSLQWHHGRVPQSRRQENTHTHTCTGTALPPTSPTHLSVLFPSITPVNRTAPHF